MVVLNGIADLAKRIRWGMLPLIPSGLLEEVGIPQNEEERSELRVVGTDDRVYSIVVTELGGE